MPLTVKGNKILANMTKEYGAKKGKAIFYASRNAGKITGVDPESGGRAPTVSELKRKARKKR
jgi:hypothetical protein